MYACSYWQKCYDILAAQQLLKRRFCAEEFSWCFRRSWHTWYKVNKKQTLKLTVIFTTASLYFLKKSIKHTIGCPARTNRQDAFNKTTAWKQEIARQIESSQLLIAKPVILNLHNELTNTTNILSLIAEIWYLLLGKYWVKNWRDQYWKWTTLTHPILRGWSLQGKTVGVTHETHEKTSLTKTACSQKKWGHTAAVTGNGH